MNKELYVYILLCADATYYVGVTNNIERRLVEHNDGINPTSYTYRRRPCKLVYWEMIDGPQKAIDREKQIKKWSKAKKEALINANLDQLHELSKCNNKSSHTKRSQ